MFDSAMPYVVEEGYWRSHEIDKVRYHGLIGLCWPRKNTSHSSVEKGHLFILILDGLGCDLLYGFGFCLLQEESKAEEVNAVEKKKVVRPKD